VAAELTGESLWPRGSVAGWFVAHVKPRQEEAVCWRLGLRSVPTFLPRLLVQRRHGSRRWEAVEPLFPGYVFLRSTGDAAALYRARWTPGVKWLLGAEDGPTPVEDAVVAYLQERMGDRGYIVPRQELVAGTRVRFRHGPFALLEGVIDRPAARAERVRVLLRLCGAVVPVEVRLEELEPV
jgi:transcription antitermination factor NusG